MLKRALVGLALCVVAILALLVMLGFGPTDIAQLFAHPIRGGTGDAVAPVAAPGASEPMGFGTANSVVLAVYLVGMLAIGVLSGRRIKNTRGFFIAEGRLNHVVVGISILGTYLSALTMMGIPGAAYGNKNWIFMVQLPFLIITAIVITRWILPRYREAGVVSIYSYLEERLGITGRMIGALGFVAFAVGRMGLVLYLPALAFHTVTGLDLSHCILVMGVIITLYTVIGGIEAVVWTDAIQVVIFVVAAVLTLGYIFWDVGVDQFLATGSEYRKFQLIVPGTDMRKLVTLWLVLETIFQTIRIYGTQQDVAQRYMTTGSVEKANRSVWISVLAYIPLGFLFYFTGTALFVYYQAHPAIVPPGADDAVYPFFVMQNLPPGVSGLVMAAIFAAAMSSIDSAMNSASTVCVEDVLKRFCRKKATEGVLLRQARLLTLLWGVLAVTLALVFANDNGQHALVLNGQIMALATNGMLAFIVLVLMRVRVRWWALLGGWSIAYGYVFCLRYLGTTYLVWPVIGNTVCLVAVLLLNRLGGESRGNSNHAPR